MRMSFKEFLEATERKAPEDKGKTKPMDSLGGREEELNIEPDVLKKILQTEPQIAAHTDFRGLNWKLMPYKIKNLNTAGADIETMDDIPGTRAFRKNRRVRGDLGGYEGHLKRKKVVDALDQGWAPAIQAAQAGGGAAGGAPPMGGGLGGL